VIEYAKSARATCKGKCKKKMDKGVLRFGSVSHGEPVMTYWRCFPQCMTEKIANNALEQCEEVSSIPGVQDLSEEDITKVIEAFDKLKEGEEADGWVSNPPAERPKKKAKKGSKKKKSDDDDEAESSETIQCPFCMKFNDFDKAFIDEDSTARGSEFRCVKCKKTFWSYVSDAEGSMGHKVEYKVFNGEDEEE
jgi:hypothetical protein